MSDPSPLPIAECHLDLPGLRAQRERYRAVGRHLARIERHPGRLEARFTDEVDTTLLAEAVEVERRCCPFFAIDRDSTDNRLSVTVEDWAHDPALDALHFALTSR